MKLDQFHEEVSVIARVESVLSCATASTASHILESHFCSGSRNIISSNILLRLREFFLWAVWAHDFLRYSYRAASVLAHSVSCSMHALLRAHSEVTKLASHATRVTSCTMGGLLAVGELLLFGEELILQFLHHRGRCDLRRGRQPA
jgi:hypothetical protein